MKTKSVIFVAIFLIISAVFVSALDGIMTGGNDGQYIVEVVVVKGWKVIAGIVPNEAIAVDSEIKSSDIKAVWYYAPNLKKYVQIHPNLDMSAQIDDDVALTSAMWVYSDKAGRLKYSTLEDYILWLHNIRQNIYINLMISSILFEYYFGTITAIE